MAQNKKVRVGTKFIETGKVYRVFKIETSPGGERILHYKPYYKGTINPTTVCSIPEKSLDRANIRLPIGKSELLRLLATLSKTSNGQTIDVVESKSILNENDIYRTTEILRCAWCEQKESEQMAKPKRDIIELAISRTIEEVALVKSISLERARTNILSALER